MAGKSPQDPLKDKLCDLLEAAFVSERYGWTPDTMARVLTLLFPADYLVNPTIEQRKAAVLASRKKKPID